MTINCNTKIPYFPFTNPFKIHLPGLKQATKPFHYEIQSLTCTQSLKKWKQFNNWSVQSIKKIVASLLFLISNSSHLATISNFNLLMSKQKPRVFREKQQTILNVVTQGNPPRKTSNNIQRLRSQHKCSQTHSEQKIHTTQLLLTECSRKVTRARKRGRRER